MAKSREERKARKDAKRQSRVDTPEESEPTTTPNYPDLRAVAKRALEPQLEFQKALDEGNLTGGPDEKAMIRPTEAKGTVQHRGMSGGWGYRSYPDGSIEIIEAPPGFEKHLEPPLSWLGPNDQMGHKANRKAAFNAITKEIGGKAPEPSGGTEASDGGEPQRAAEIDLGEAQVTPEGAYEGAPDGMYSDPGYLEPGAESQGVGGITREDGEPIQREVLDPAEEKNKPWRDIKKDAALVGEGVGKAVGRTVDLGKQTASVAKSVWDAYLEKKRREAEIMSQAISTTADLGSKAVSGATEGFGKGYGE